MAQANNGEVIPHVGEEWINQVPVHEMTRDQLETRAIRIILDQLMRNDLRAVPISFDTIANVTIIRIVYTSNLTVVPECINRLTGLRVLDLGLCKLNRDDSFPDTFWQLTRLEKLNLCCNKLTSIPSRIAKLTSLRKLEFGYCNLLSIPREIGELKNLTHLELGDNGLSSVPKEIGKLTSLMKLDLFGNNLDSVPDEIYQLTNLTFLMLSKNYIESISEEIGNLTKLETLGVDGNQLTKLPKNIGKLVNLQINHDDDDEGPYGLWIDGNPLTSLPDSIRKVKHALDEPDKKEYKLLLEDVDTRATQRLQRRLVILLAKVPDDENDEKSIYQVLQDPKLVKIICEYIS